jgi:NADH:ubiquinone oxidoreductase subunit E
LSHAVKKHFEQPASFVFTEANLKAIDSIIAKYPKGLQASAVMPLLEIAQRQNDNWIPEKAMEEIARILDMPRIKVFEVAVLHDDTVLAGGIGGRGGRLREASGHKAGRDDG